MTDETPEPKSKKGISGVVLVGCLILGMGIGFAVGSVLVGLFIGLGVGFLGMAAVRYKVGEW
ncbi:hypothetical protein ACFLVA_01135 [Chloroflexota bacterium]